MISNGVIGLNGTNLFGPGTDEVLISHSMKVYADAVGSMRTGQLAGPQTYHAVQYSYDDWGKPTLLSNQFGPYETLVGDHRFTGRDLDLETPPNSGDETGLMYYRARYYDPTIGRFISEDPIGFAGGVNFYAYVHNNPINMRDPYGLYDGWDLAKDAGTFSEAFADTLTFGSASRLNNALGANVAVNRCGWVHKSGTVAGIAFSAVVGGEGLANGLKTLSNTAKGNIGEALSLAENTLRGGRLVGTEIRAADLGLKGLTTRFDSVWRFGRGIVYVESKFGTSGLTQAQGIAARALGSSYQVQRWTYPFFTRVGSYLGAGAGTISSQATGDCGCE